MLPLNLQGLAHALEMLLEWIIKCKNQWRRPACQYFISEGKVSEVGLPSYHPQGLPGGTNDASSSAAQHPGKPRQKQPG
jgi:hypothetical protein